MCFLAQNLPPLLLFLLRFLRAFLDGLASLSDSPSHALGRLGLGSSSRRAVHCGALMLSYANHNVAGALLVTKTSPHRRRTHTLPTRTFIDAATGDVQRIHVERRAGIVSFALGVGDGAAQRL